MLSLASAAVHVGWALQWDAARAVPNVRSGEDVPHACSVVVCCRNEAHQLEAFRRGLAPALARWEREGRTVEVVAVDDGSTDGTFEHLQAIAATDARWRPVRLAASRPGKKDALTLGMARAAHPVRVLLDADCRPAHEAWLLHMTRGAERAWDVNVGIGWPEPRTGPSGKPLLNALQRLEAERLAQRAVGAVRGGRPYLAFGRNLAVTQQAWAQTTGMENHAHLPSGDDDLWLQEAHLGGARVRDCVHPEAHTVSRWPETWTAWRVQKTRHFTASPAYPWRTKVWLALPILAWWGLVAGVVHNPGGTSLGCMALAVAIRTLTFGQFLRQTGQPGRGAWRLLLEPLVSAFRGWAWCQGQTSDPKPWK